MVKTHNFRELQIWKESIAFVKSAYYHPKKIGAFKRTLNTN